MRFTHRIFSLNPLELSSRFQSQNGIMTWLNSRPLDLCIVINRIAFFCSVSCNFLLLLSLHHLRKVIISPLLFLLKSKIRSWNDWRYGIWFMRVFNLKIRIIVSESSYIGSLEIIFMMADLKVLQIWPINKIKTLNNFWKEPLILYYRQ